MQDALDYAQLQLCESTCVCVPVCVKLCTCARPCLLVCDMEGGLCIMCERAESLLLLICSAAQSADVMVSLSLNVTSRTSTSKFLSQKHQSPLYPCCYCCCTGCSGCLFRSFFAVSVWHAGSSVPYKVIPIPGQSMAAVFHSVTLSRDGKILITALNHIVSETGNRRVNYYVVAMVVL